jgi:hypothetical protein
MPCVVSEKEILVWNWQKILLAQLTKFDKISNFIQKSRASHFHQSLVKMHILWQF